MFLDADFEVNVLLLSHLTILLSDSKDKSGYQWRALRLVLKSSYAYSFRYLERQISCAPSAIFQCRDIRCLFLYDSDITVRHSCSSQRKSQGHYCNKHKKQQQISLESSTASDAPCLLLSDCSCFLCML